MIVLNIIICILIILIIVIVICLNYNKNHFKNEYKISNKVSKNEIENLKKGQIIMTDMIRIFHNLCEKNNIKYWVQAGTLIGTVRHKGWIPWDGDVDISMLRNDYNKLKIIINELPSHMIFSEPIDHPCSKIRSTKAIYIPTKYSQKSDWNMGIQIDIFISNIINKNNKKIIQAEIINGRQFPVCGTPGKKEINYEDIFPLKKLVFDNILVNVPNKYEKICKETWGDYPPKLPPINKRYCHEGGIKIISNNL